jgi:hypothetical protein
MADLRPPAYLERSTSSELIAAIVTPALVLCSEQSSPVMLTAAPEPRRSSGSHGAGLLAAFLAS